MRIRYITRKDSSGIIGGTTYQIKFGVLSRWTRPQEPILPSYTHVSDAHRRVFQDDCAVGSVQTIVSDVQKHFWSKLF